MATRPGSWHYEYWYLYFRFFVYSALQPPTGPRYTSWVTRGGDFIDSEKIKQLGSISDHRIFLVVAGEAQRHCPRLKRYFNKHPEIILIQTNSSIEDVLDECQKLVPCVLLVDFGFVAELRRPGDFAQKVGFGKTTPVLVLTEHESEQAIESLLRIGCRGFIQTEAAPSLLCRAVHAIASGELWAPRKFLSRVLQNLLSSNPGRNLTAREAEILSLVVQGYTNKEAAEALCISRETVRWHMRMLYGKLGVHDRMSAALQVEGRSLVGNRLGRVSTV